MNWTEIKEKHPKAWNNLIFFIGMGYGMSTEISSKDFLLLHGSSGEHHDQMPFPIRDLYDFFDEQGISVCVMRDTMTEKRWFVEVFEDKPHNIDGVIFKWQFKIEEDHEFDSRNNAEDYIFTKAFEMLEEKLSNNQTN